MSNSKQVWPLQSLWSGFDYPPWSHHIHRRVDQSNLNIRAERRASPVGAGVEVTGSLEKPNTVLVADEAMSDKDKLSWLILGRPSSGDSDDAAIAAAAGAWLAGNINDKVGIVDNIGLKPAVPAILKQVK